MKKILQISLIASLTITASLAESEISTVDNFTGMFQKAKVSGELKTIFADYKQKEIGTHNSYATAAGGILKYELASLNGFNSAVAFTTSKDIFFTTGEKEKHNNELSSTEKEHTQLSEVYINYKYNDLNLRAGRQIIDTPLADSDDIRMIANRFEAYMATYEISDFTFMAGNIQKWYGFDAGLDDNWISTGDKGVTLASVSYSDIVESSFWYYNISLDGEQTDALYADLSYEYSFNDTLSIHGAIQYLNEREIDNSGVEADIYGAMLEGTIYDMSVTLAYNNSIKKEAKRSFAGIGGGAMFTNMDTMIIDEITEDREVEVILFALAYSYENFNFSYSYGNFNGDKNSDGIKMHITEQDIGLEYNLDDELIVSGVYIIQEDRESSAKTEYDWERTQLMVKYSF
ncbi:MAG: OprD family outer membrane porin [Campylobacterota bacterium]|nr:OprD family outer membrane porin [Campylobacterota bacterium]